MSPPVPKVKDGIGDALRDDLVKLRGLGGTSEQLRIVDRLLRRLARLAP